MEYRNGEGQLLGFAKSCSHLFEAPNRKALMTLVGETAVNLTHGTRAVVEEHKTSEGIVGEVFRTRRSFVSNDPTSSLLAVPILTPEGMVLGVIQVFESKHGKFTEEDQQALQALSILAAKALLGSGALAGALGAAMNGKEVTPGNEGPTAKVIDLRTAKELLEQDLIQRALSQTHGNKSHAARLLGITREGLRKAMKKAA